MKALRIFLLAALFLAVFGAGKVEAGAISVSICGQSCGGYDPTDVEIYSGDTVSWTNDDTSTHSVTDKGGQFDSYGISPGDSWQVTFTLRASIEINGERVENSELEFNAIEDPAYFEYKCKYHANMEGSIQILVDENDPFNYEWTIEGDTYPGKSVSYTFDSAGNYDVILSYYNSTVDRSVEYQLYIEQEEIIRDLAVTVIDAFQEIYPEYGGSAAQNSVKFKVKLENTGSHKDTYIPEVESTLEDDWSVSFWQDSGKTQSWPASGMDIEAGELNDLWVFVEVDDEADEGSYTIEISVHDEDDNPDAREEISLTIIVQRPELTISPDNIRLEIEGVMGNASMLKDGDTVVVLVDVENTGTADADDVRVEVFYYPKRSPTTQTEIDDLVIAGFVLDEGKNTYIYTLYDKEANIKSNNKKSFASDDWIIRGGEWYVEVRVDYDEDDSNGKILEPNENNNDARYAEPLLVKPDLSIDAMRVDSKYGGPVAQTPNIDDTVSFTVTVSNKGAADVRDARLYITADSSSDNEILMERSNKEYVKFDVDAGETTEIRFRWKATEDDWSSFRAEINPVCDDYDIDAFTCEQEGDGFASETDRMFDELGRYTNNEYPATGVFEQNGVEVRFEVLPDFKIKKVTMDPSDPEVGENVEMTVTIENIGNADWQIGSKPLLLTFEDGVGTVVNAQIGESINKDNSIEVTFTWTVPDEDTLVLTFTIDAGSGNFEITQCDSCDYSSPGDGKDNDEYTYAVTIGPPNEKCVDGDTKDADDGCNQCICNNEEWVCTEVACDDNDSSLPSISLIPALISIGLIAIYRRK